MRKALIVLLLPLILSNCGDPTDELCDGNVSTDGFYLNITLRNADSVSATYDILICKNTAARGAVLSVYGGDDQDEIDEILGASDSVLEARAAEPGIIDDSSVGESFEITLPVDNEKFVVYEAELDGATFVLGNTDKIIEGDLIPE